LPWLQKPFLFWPGHLFPSVQPSSKLRVDTIPDNTTWPGMVSVCWTWHLELSLIDGCVWLAQAALSLLILHAQGPCWICYFLKGLMLTLKPATQAVCNIPASPASSGLIRNRGRTMIIQSMHPRLGTNQQWFSILIRSVKCNHIFFSSQTIGNGKSWIWTVTQIFFFKKSLWEKNWSKYIRCML
jgi:hypothetical protein